MTAPAGPELADRVSYARSALQAHQQATDGPATDETDGIVHLLSDLMHLGMDLGVDFGELTVRAQHHFCEERILNPSAAALIS